MSCTRAIGTSPPSSSSMDQSVSLSNGSGMSSLPNLTSGELENGVNGSNTSDAHHGRCTTPIFGKPSPSTSATSSQSPLRPKMRVYTGGVSSPVAPTSASRQGAMTPTTGMWTTPAAGALTPVSSGSKTGYCTTGSATRRRMRGLVRRTHSPRNMPSPLASPVQPHHIVLSPTSSNRNLVMRPSPRQGSSSKASPVSCLAQAMNRTATTLKRKRKHDDNIKTFAPVIKKKRKSSPQCSPSQRRYPNAISAVNVMTVNPTVRGIAESARVLLCTTSSTSSSSEPVQNENANGILSFPTETVYTLCCGVAIPPKNSNASATSTRSDHKSVLDQLLQLKGRQNAQNKNDVASDDPPLLYLHHSTQAERYAHFTKPKTFVLKPPSQSSPPGTPSGVSSDAETPSNTKLTAVTFSESREVYRRLTDAFWPGPLVIYVRSADKTGDTVHNTPSQVAPQAAAVSNVDGPVLPKELLSHAKITTEQSSQGNTNQKEQKEAQYIGLRCPSHPLARKILAEAYYGPPSTSRARRRSRNIAIVGFSASPCLPSSKDVGQVNVSGAPTRAGEVCARLLSFKSGDAFSDPSSPPLVPANPSNATVHVLNGEAKREIFSVPTCQFGTACPVSILIDDEQRTVHVFKVKKQSTSTDASLCHTSKNYESAEKTQSHPHADITVDLVTKALLRPSPISVVSGGRNESSDDGRSSSIGSSGSLGGSSCSSSGVNTVGTGARLVTAILRKWKVVGEEG